MVFKLLCLGDSYTCGELVPQMESWPYVLKDLFPLDVCDKGGVDLKVVAVTGWTTDELSAGIAEEEGKNAFSNTPYDMVTLLIGVNNQYRERSCEEYIEQFKPLLEKALSFAGNNCKKVCVISIPDWGVTPFAAKSGRDVTVIANQIDAFNAAAANVAQNSGVAFIDITPFTREAPQDPELVTEDGLHPSGKDYKRWANKIMGFCTENVFDIYNSTS
jgi:lysophospholipase L1-like esterase